MKTAFQALRLPAWAVGFLWAAASLSAQPTPLTHAHAHNDYEHKRPLFDALDHGFCSIEADIWLVDGQLLVAHDRWGVKKERTLQALYLDPLRERIRQNHGRLYPGGPPCTLLIDVKSDAEATYAVLRQMLQQYADIFTAFTPTNTVTNALTAILTGNRATSVLAAEPLRYAAIDGRLPDLDANPSPRLVPLVSDNWTKYFKWRGLGPLPDAERQKLEQIVQRAHRQGRLVRFWAAPDNPVGWKALQDAGVDILNADDLVGLQKFLLGKAP